MQVKQAQRRPKVTHHEVSTLFPVIIEQVLISAYLIKKSRIYTDYMENKMIFERYQHLFDYHGKHSTRGRVSEHAASTVPAEAPRSRGTVFS